MVQHVSTQAYASKYVVSLQHPETVDELIRGTDTCWTPMLGGGTGTVQALSRGSSMQDADVFH